MSEFSEKKLPGTGAESSYHRFLRGVIWERGSSRFVSNKGSNGHLSTRVAPRAPCSRREVTTTGATALIVKGTKGNNLKTGISGGHCAGKKRNWKSKEGRHGDAGT